MAACGGGRRAHARSVWRPTRYRSERERWLWRSSSSHPGRPAPTPPYCHRTATVLPLQYATFSMGGWWLGGSHMKPNPAFMAEVQVGGSLAGWLGGQVRGAWASHAGPEVGLVGEVRYKALCRCQPSVAVCPRPEPPPPPACLLPPESPGLDPHRRKRGGGLPEGPALAGGLRAAEPRGVRARGRRRSAVPAWLAAVACGGAGWSHPARRPR